MSLDDNEMHLQMMAIVKTLAVTNNRSIPVQTNSCMGDNSLRTVFIITTWHIQHKRWILISNNLHLGVQAYNP